MAALRDITGQIRRLKIDPTKDQPFVGQQAPQ